jgi:hypothetical protein
MQTRFSGIAVLALLSVVGQLSCGGGGGGGIGGSMGPPNPVPTIQALSPNSSKQGGPAFTLSVLGSNFLPNSAVQWNGSSLQTTFVSSNLVTADIPASAVSGPGPDAITVSNPSPGGGVSNSLNFTVPCVIAPPAPASTQTHARLGAYYFDGWSGPVTNFHFNGMVNGPYQDREPLSGWQDNSSCAIERQLAWAHEFGIDFFVFDWYYNVPVNEFQGDNLNNALQQTLALPDRHGMQFAIMYTNGPPFVVPPTDWASTINEWIGYMKDRDYVRVNGKPLLMIYSMGLWEQAPGWSSSAIASALNQLRATAQAQGLPGVYVVGGLDAAYYLSTQTVNIDPSLATAGGYDAMSMYNFSVTGVSGLQPFSILYNSGKSIWAHIASTSSLPFIPVAMDGWDPRPSNEGNVWFNRTPQDVTGFVSAAITWANSNPPLRPEPAPTPPLVLIEAWNELGEDSNMVPTVGDGTTYGDSLAAMLQAP